MLFSLYSRYEKAWLQSQLVPISCNPYGLQLCFTDGNKLYLFGGTGNSLNPLVTRFASPVRYIWIPINPCQGDLSAPSDFVQVLADSQIELFIQADEACLYVGPSRLGAIAYPEEVGVEYEFALENQLPKDVWLNLGGYAGWMVTINDRAIRNITSIIEIDELARELSDVKTGRVCITRYENDVFAAYLSEHRDVVTYRDDNGRSFVSMGVVTECEEFVDFSYSGENQDLEFSSKFIISREETLILVINFLRHGTTTALFPL